MKALMIGLGGIGQRHLRNLRQLLGEKVEIFAYRVRKQSQVLTDNLQIEPGQNLEEKYRVTSFDDLDQALAIKPDIGFVCNPSSLHIPTALALVRAGCHVLIEKPLSHNLDQVEELAALLEQKNRVGLVAYQMRFHPCLQRVQALLAAKTIGRVLAVQAEVGEYLPGWHKYEDYRHMYAARADLGGGVILSQIHEMDYLYALFGLPHRLFALGGKLSNLEIEVEDTASILMECSLDGQSLPIHLHQDYVQRPPSRTLKIVGNQGKILADFCGLTVHVFDEKGDLTENTSFAGLQRNQLFMDELKHFLACVRGQEKPIVSVRQGAHSLRMAFAAKQSLLTGGVISLA